MPWSAKLKEHTAEAKLKLSKLQITWLSIVLLVAATGIGAFLWQRQQNDDELANLRRQLDDVQNTTSKNDALSTTGANEALTTETSQVCDPAIVHEPSEAFASASRAELAKKLSHPFRDYFAEQRQCPASIRISYRAGDTQYAVFVIFGHDSSSGFFFGDTGAVTQPWWSPECEDSPCQFSDTYKDKYPEVVEAAGR